MKDQLILELYNSNSDEEKLEKLTKIANYMQTNGKINDERFILELLELMKSKNDFVRIKITELAEFYTDDRIIEGLREKLKSDTNYFVRGFAAKALGSIGNIKVKTDLQIALQDEEKFVSSFAAQSLKTINMKVSFSGKLNMLKAKMQERNK